MSSFQMSVPTQGSVRAVSNLKRVLTPGITDDERNKRYDVFSKTYDQDSRDFDYQAPTVAALAMAALFTEENRESLAVLDIGAGTGFVGEEMQKHGFKIFDALEPSQGMLDQLVKKGVYRKCIRDSISSCRCLNIDDNTYDIITVVGSHGHNHIESEAMKEMIRIVRPGGYICIVARNENFTTVSEYKDSFFPLCEKLEHDGKWRKVECSNCAYLPNIEGLKIIYRVCK